MMIPGLAPSTPPVQEPSTLDDSGRHRAASSFRRSTRRCRPYPARTNRAYLRSVAVDRDRVVDFDAGDAENHLGVVGHGELVVLEACRRLTFVDEGRARRQGKVRDCRWWLTKFAGSITGS